VAVYFWTHQNRPLDATPGLKTKEGDPWHSERFGAKRDPEPQAKAASQALPIPPTPSPAVRPTAVASVPGLQLVPIEQQWLPPEIRAKALQALKNFKETGSINGGKKTHEFARMNYMSRRLEQVGIADLVSKLAITPIHLAQIAGGDFVLVGADFSGKLIEERGFTGFFQIAQSASDARMVELLQDQREHAAGDTQIIDPGFINYDVFGYPATLEQLRDTDEAPLINLRWQMRDRRFSMTAKNLQMDDVIVIAQRITEQFKMLPNDGWKKPYVPDPLITNVPAVPLPPSWAPPKGTPTKG
jgi:hypothetical protein